MEQKLNLNSTDWEHFFKLAKRICKENKLKEFHYKFLHRNVIRFISRLFTWKQNFDKKA